MRAVLGPCCQDRELSDWFGLGRVLTCGAWEWSGVSGLRVEELVPRGNIGGHDWNKGERLLGG